MKYLFIYLWAIVKWVLMPFNMTYEWFLVWGDKAWCIVWHLGHDWKYIYKDRANPKPNAPMIFWCERCHTRKVEEVCTKCNGIGHTYGAVGGHTVLVFCSCKKGRP